MKTNLQELKRRNFIWTLLLWSLATIWGANMGYQEYPTFEPMPTYIDPSLPRTLDPLVLVVCLSVGACAGFCVFFVARQRRAFTKALLLGYLCAALIIPACLNLFQQIQRYNFYYGAFGGLSWEMLLVSIIISSIWQVPLALIGTVGLALMYKLTLGREHDIGRLAEAGTH
jgi:uncharacterized membrane protein